MASLPDFMTDANAVLKDTEASWSYNRIRDYNKVNATFLEERTKVHEEGSLEWLVSNLVKEMSCKLKAEEIRTINVEIYRFSVNGKTWQNADEMLKIGTYNALIGDTELYKASEMDFVESHKLFKMALLVAFKWRHWGFHSGDLPVKIGKDNKLEAHATNTVIEVFGVTIAKVNNKFEIEQLETFYDPTDMLRQMAKNPKDLPAPSGKCPFNPAN